MTPPRFIAVVSLGANLGDAQQALDSALAGLAQLPATDVLGVSSFYKTTPVGAQGPDYLNAVALLACSLGPLELLHALMALELAHGRERPFKHAPRTLDLDLIWFGGASRASAELTLPHPRWRGRAFVVEPLAEVLNNPLADTRAAMGLLGGAEAWPAALAELSAQLPALTVRQAMACEQGIEKIGGPSQINELNIW